MPVVRKYRSVPQVSEEEEEESLALRNDAAAAVLDPSCSSSPATLSNDDDETVITSSTSSNSLTSLSSSSRDEAEQTLRKRPSFQSLEDVLAESAASSASNSNNDVSSSSASAMSSVEQLPITKPLKKSRSAQSLQDLIISRPLVDASILPDPKTAGVDPDEYLAQLVVALYGVKLQPKAALELNDFFPTITEDQMSAYTMDVVTATRQNKVDDLRKIVQDRGPEAVNCFNRFGESLLNNSCRRGFAAIVKFFLSDEVGLNVRTRDDGGRTPMHDACWNPEPLLDICTWLMEKDPSLFLVSDKRGYTAFQYARKSDWHIWRKFLFDNRHLLQGLAQPDIVRIFS